MATKSEPRADIIKVEDGRLIIDVALLPGDGKRSVSGKTNVFWTTGSPTPEVDGYRLNATLYRKP